MLVNKPRENALFDSAIRELARDGVAPSPHESAWLYHLCREAAGGDYAVDPFLAPVVVARGVSFYPVTIGAMIWLDNCAAHWWDGDVLMQSLAEAYALAHANDAEAFSRICERSIALQVVMRWARKCPLTVAELRRVIDACNGSVSGVVNVPWATYKPNPPQSSQWGAMVSKICAKYPALTPDDVAWRMPMGRVLAFAREAREGEEDQLNDNIYQMEALRAAIATIRGNHGGG